MTQLAYPKPNNVPPAVRNNLLKYGYTYAVQEEMRLLHNRVGKWRREGLTQAEYDALPDYIRDLQPYVSQLTQAQWDWFLGNWWEPRSGTLTSDLLELREIAKGYVIQFQANIDLEAIPT